MEIIGFNNLSSTVSVIYPSVDDVVYDFRKFLTAVGDAYRRFCLVDVLVCMNRTVFRSLVVHLIFFCDA